MKHEQPPGGSRQIVSPHPQAHRLGARVDYFSNESLHRDLAGRTVRGGMITGSAQVLRVLIGLASVGILARLLLPEDFGLVAMVAFFTNFAAMFVDSGLSMATVQRDEINHRQASNLFWIGAALGTLIAIIVACLSPAIAWFYDEPRLVAITLALACSYVLSGMTVQHQALLKRAMQFHRIAAVDICSLIAGHTAGILWAWYYYEQPSDYFALVCIPIVTSFTRMVLVWSFCHWRPGLPQRGAGTRDMVAFGANLTGFNFVNYFARNADNLIIGWWWGPVSLGFYERTYRLLLFPMQQVPPALSTVVIPALSRLRDSPERYRRAYLSAVRPLVWVGMLLVGFLFAVSEPLVLLYMGVKWQPVVGLFRALAPAALVSSFICSAGWVYMSWGHVDRHFKWGIVHSLIVLATIMACVPFGTLAVAGGISAIYVILRAPSFYICYYGTPIRLADLGNIVWRPLLIVLVSGGIGYVVSEQRMALERATDFWPLTTTFALTAAAFLISCGLLIAILPGTLAELKRIAEIAKLRKRPSSAPVASQQSPA